MTIKRKRKVSKAFISVFVVDKFFSFEQKKRKITKKKGRRHEEETETGILTDSTDGIGD